MRTVHLRNPVVLRTREPDPQGQPPVDVFGQRAKHPFTGEELAPSRIVTHHYKRGANQMPDEHADHPYIKASAIEGSDMAPDYTIEQLEAMLADARARALGGGEVEQKNVNAISPGFEWPSDDVLEKLDHGSLAVLLGKRGLTAPAKKDDRLNMAIDWKAKDAAAVK